MLPIKKIVKETPTVKTFFVDYSEISSVVQPGQFIMLWVIGVDEIPMSVSGAKRNGELGMSIAKVGDATSRLHELGEGDMIGIRGPYGGNWFDLSGKNLLIVGGGYGMGPLAFAAEVALSEGKEVTVILGAKTADELLFRSRLKKLGVDLAVSTEDGSAGIKGFATDLLPRILLKREFDSCLSCGPEKMMMKVAEIVEEKKIPVQLSLERYMKCGLGLCGQCCIDPLGVRVCTEGPVFFYHQLKDTEFGNYARDAAGVKRRL